MRRFHKKIVLRLTLYYLWNTASLPWTIGGPRDNFVSMDGGISEPFLLFSFTTVILINLTLQGEGGPWIRALGIWFCIEDALFSKKL